MRQLSFQSEHSYAGTDASIGLFIELLLNGRNVRLQAKVDTGASFCIFQREYAEGLGIDVESGERKKFATATGTFVAYGHSLTLSCLGHHVEAVVYFAESPEFNRNVLGLTGWLNHFRLGLIHEDSMLYLSPYDDDL